MPDDHGDVEGESRNPEPGNTRPYGSVLRLRNREVMDKSVRRQSVLRRFCR